MATEAELKARKFNPYFIQFLQEPFDEYDVAKLYKSSKPVNSMMEIAMVWGMLRAAEMIEANGHEGAVKTFKKVLDNGLISANHIPCYEEIDEAIDEMIEDEDLL